MNTKYIVRESFGDYTNLETKANIAATLFAYSKFYGKVCEEVY